MIANAIQVQKIVIYEGPDSQPLDAEFRFSLVQGLLKSGYAARMTRLADDVGAAASQSIIVLGDLAGSMPEWLGRLVQNGRSFAHDIRGLPVEQIVQRVVETCQKTALGTAGGWKPWFPVIDYDRCTNCMQCLSFCLFDVYGVTDKGKINVQNQSNCKTDCPACSRVCPEVAILFPKYKAGPINGDEVNSDDIRREAMKVDISALLGGDIYSMLRDRSAKAKSRFSKERDDDRALKERQRCLTKLKDSMDLEIPTEVLSSLPSIDQIQKKAVEAKKKAADAIAMNAAVNSSEEAKG